MEHLTISNTLTDYDTRDKHGNGIIVWVDFDNGAGISFLLDSLSSDPLFYTVMSGEEERPTTDGKRIYWKNGAALTIPEMMSIVLAANETEAV